MKITNFDKNRCKFTGRCGKMAAMHKYTFYKYLPSKTDILTNCIVNNFMLIFAHKISILLYLTSLLVHRCDKTMLMKLVFNKPASKHKKQ